MNKRTEYILLGIISLGLLLMILLKCNELNKSRHIFPSISSEMTIPLNLQPKVRSSDLVLGQTNAPISVFLYTSYNCRACSDFFQDTYPKIKDRLIEKGEIKLVIRGLAFNNEPEILKALQATLCFANDGRFDEINQILMEYDGLIFSNVFNDFIEDLVYKDPEIADCIFLEMDYNQFKEDKLQFKKIGISGVPKMIICGEVYQVGRNINALERIIAYHIKKNKTHR